MGDLIDRRVLTLIRGCKNNTGSGSICCTENCPYRATCPIRKTPFLIYTQSVKIDMDFTEFDESDESEISFLSFEITKTHTEEYINEAIVISEI